MELYSTSGIVNSCSVFWMYRYGSLLNNFLKEYTSVTAFFQRKVEYYVESKGQCQILSKSSIVEYLTRVLQRNGNATRHPGGIIKGWLVISNCFVFFFFFWPLLPTCSANEAFDLNLQLYSLPKIKHNDS